MDFLALLFFLAELIYLTTFSPSVWELYIALPQKYKKIMLINFFVYIEYAKNEKCSNA